jgi:tetratricopeptide (TPR) repeat protein
MKVLNVDTQAERFEEPPQSNMITSEAIEEVYEKEILPLIKSTETAAFRGTRSLGLTFLACEHVAEAIDTLNKALVVDPGDLPARNALADAYALEIKAQSVLPNWDEALRHKDIVIEQLKAGMKLYTEEEADISLRLRMSDKATWLRDLKRYEESQELLLGLLKEDPNDDENRLQLMRTLHQCQKFGHVVELIQAMETDVDESTKNTAISRFLQCHAANDTCHTVLASVYQQESRLKDLTSYYRLAINDCAGSKHWTAQWRHFYLIDRLASMLFKFGVGSTEQEEAIALWEKVVKDDKGDRDQFVRQLCKAYLAQAREAGHGSTIANAMIAKIKAFLPQPNEEIGEVDVSQAEVRALLARYYRCVGDFAKAKETLRPDMELALNLLSDEDDENDWQGYRKLGDALMDFGAMEEARAAWSLIQPSQGISHLRERTPSPGRSNSEGTPSSTDETSSEDDGDEPSSTAKHDADAPRTAPEGTAPSTDRPQLKRANTTMVPRGPLSYNCDGRCGKHWTYADDFYICCECIDIQFSPDCLKKLQAGQLEREVCDANHQFLHVPAWTLASAQRARDKKVLVGEEEKEIASWLREIEQAWQLKVLDAKSVPA